MSNVVVALEEEYGYRYWLWDTGMNEADLIQWLKSQKEDDTFIFLKIPGKKQKSSLKKFKELSKKNHWHGMFHQLDDSYLISPDGEVHHTNWVPTSPY